MNEKITDKLKNKIGISVLFSIPAFIGLCKLLIDAGFRSVFTWTGFSVFILLLIVFAELGIVQLITGDGKDSGKILRYSFIYGLLFGIATDAGYQFQTGLMTAPGIRGKLIIVITGAMLSFLMLPLTYRIFRFVAGLYKTKIVEAPDQKKLVKAFFISWAVLQICWLPAFLAYYPAIMSYDFNRQFGEAVKGYSWFYEYQPLAHTFLIRMFYLLGDKLGSLQTGMAVFAFLQSLSISASISACLVYVYKKTGKVPAFLHLAAFAFLPFNPVLAVSMTKDILFTAFFVLLLLVVLNMEEEKRTCMILPFVILGILNILFRSNAPYALLFLVPAFLIAEKNLKKKILMALVSFVMVISGIGCKNLIRNTMDAIPGSEIEMYSVPIVQMVRVIKYQNDNLTDTEREILSKYIPDTCWGEYVPSIADGPKFTIAMYNSGVWENDKMTLIKDYLKIGKSYWNDYLDAWIGLTIGYWFIDDRSHAEMLGFGDDTGHGLLFTFNASFNDLYPDGIESHSYLPGVYRMYSHIVNGNAYYDWPVVSQLMKPAFYFWIFMLVIFACIFKRNKKSILILAYPVMYFMTMLLGPCVNFRYMYPFIVIMPVLVAFSLSESGGHMENGEQLKSDVEAAAIISGGEKDKNTDK